MEAHRADAAQSLKLHPMFYRRVYRAMLKAVFINSILLSALCVLTAYLSFYGFKPEYYFTTTAGGRILELHYRVTPTYPKPPLESSAANGQPAPAPQTN